MKCYHCGCELTEKDFCSNCGADVSLYKKLMSLSNLYYNEGLEKASVRNLTGAVESLHQSLKLNKSNIEARNLLGLVYYEMGEVVAALSEWVISKNLDGESNIADDYMNELRNNPTRLDTMNQTMKKYNIALRYCQQGSLDLAVIQLKKVLSMNPNFIRAHQLLALLYLNTGNYSKAERELQKCARIDTGNTLTQRYLMEAQHMQIPGEDEAKHISEIPSSKEVVQYRSGNETIIQPVHSLQPKGAVSMLSIAIGAVLGIAIACFLILPARIQAINSSNKDRITAISEESDSKSAQLTEYEQQIADLTKEKKTLQSQIDSYQGTDSTVDSMNALMAATSTYLTSGASDIQTIAGYLEHVNPAKMGSSATAEFTELYNALIKLVGPRLASMYYRTGYSAYKQKDYDTAITDLTAAYQYDSTNGDALFYLGNCYYEKGNTDQAKKIYDQVINDFPGTRKASNSEAKIAEINNAAN